ncbi:MAG: hypothetical protein QOI63_697 [Thermoplasmata archaeon]|jgi:hypothetical protein|nr:hypothetical protein [Thermoplasmata archaeon]
MNPTPVLIATLALGLAMLAIAPSANAKELKGGEVVGGPCGCNCPVVGGGATVEAAGQKATVVAATEVIVCGTGVWYDVVTGPLDPTAPITVTPIVVCYGVVCPIISTSVAP